MKHLMPTLCNLLPSPLDLDIHRQETNFAVGDNAWDVERGKRKKEIEGKIGTLETRILLENSVLFDEVPLTSSQFNSHIPEVHLLFWNLQSKCNKPGSFIIFKLGFLGINLDSFRFHR